MDLFVQGKLTSISNFQLHVLQLVYLDIKV